MTANRVLALVGFAVIPALFSSPPARADGGSDARKRFDRGVALVEEGSFAEALVEFEKAYALVPNFAVLFNIGMAHVALGHPVEAVDVLERYLLDGGVKVPAARRARVEEELVRQRGRIAVIEVDALPEGSEVRVDGNLIGKTPLALPIKVAMGTHKVIISHEKHVTSEQTVRVASDEKALVDVTLESVAPPILPTRRLRITCALPGVQIRVDDVLFGTTPVRDGSVVIPAESKQVAFARAGYVDLVVPLTPVSSEPAEVDCAMKRMSVLSSEISGTLRVSLIPADAAVFIDGEGLPANGVVPAGPHHLEVSRRGFRSWRRDIDVAWGSTVTYSVRLEVEPEELTRAFGAERRRRNLSIAIGGAGLALGATSLGLYLWNGSRYDRWRDERDAIRGAWLTADATSPSLAARRSANDSLARSINVIDYTSLGLALGSGALVTTAIVRQTLFSSPMEGLNLSAGAREQRVTWGTTW